MNRLPRPRHSRIRTALIAEDDPDTFSRVIMRVIRRAGSHIIIVVDERWVYHCVPGGVKKELLSQVMKGCHVVEEVWLEPDPGHDFGRDIDPFSHALGWLEGSLGGKYAMLQNLGIAFAWLRGLVGNGARERNCSEYGACFIRYGLGYVVKAFENPDWVNPGHYIDAVKKIRVRR